VFLRGVFGPRAEYTPNPSLHPTCVSRLRRLPHAGELKRWASVGLSEHTAPLSPALGLTALRVPPLNTLLQSRRCCITVPTVSLSSASHRSGIAAERFGSALASAWEALAAPARKTTTGRASSVHLRSTAAAHAARCPQRARRGSVNVARHEQLWLWRLQRCASTITLMPNPSLEPTVASRLRRLAPAAQLQRWAYEVLSVPPA
jgi:hypothetical protein